MSHGERQAWPDAASVPSQGTGGGTTALEAPPRTEAVALAGAEWELLYRSVSSHQADLLTLASKQGLLHRYELPAAPTSRSLAPVDEPRAWNLLGKMLSGHVGQLEPTGPVLLAVVDDALNEAQRYAVAAALATPDVCLIQGGPGTGKSRVVAEIVTQAAKRGDRVLLLAAHTAALDSVLEQIANRDSLCPVRCLGADENLALLPASIRALTLHERTIAIRQNTLRTASETRQAAELQSARRRHEESLWSQLEELATTLAEVRQALAKAEARMAATQAEVAHDVEADSGRLAEQVRAVKKAGEERLAQLAAEVSAVQAQGEQDTNKLAELARQMAGIEPLAAAKRQRQWWSPTWWKAFFKGNVVGRLAELDKERGQFQAAVDTGNQRLQDLQQACHTATAKTKEDIQARLEAEVTARQRKLLPVIERHRDEVQRHDSLWSDLCRQIDDEALRPAAQTPEAIKAAQELWRQRRQDDEARCASAREWAGFLESSSAALAARLPGFANLVAATPAALAADPHFADAAASGGQFDLLVFEEAHLLAESEFLKAARRARQWILVGEPPLCSDHRPEAAANRHQRGQCFHQLWHSLHCDPSALPHAWFHEGQRLCCRLRHVANSQRQWLECEPLADVPEVELRILVLPGTRPVLAEVSFPATMTLPQAKEFLFHELQEITVQTAGRGLRWSESDQAVVLQFTPEASDALAVPLDTGVREFLDGTHFDNTCKLEFNRAAGWDRAAVRLWLDKHLHLRDFGRTVRLDKPQRMMPALADIVGDLLGIRGEVHREPLTAPAAPAEPAVVFIPVPSGSKAKTTGRNDGRGPRKTDSAGIVATGGAGLETDLASLRGERVPDELRGFVGGRGIVNVQEARAVVRKVEELVRQETNHANCQDGCLTVHLAVIALYPAQADLIRHLIQHSPKLAGRTASIVIGPPSAFRHREADVVLVSLTRSHGHRAVAYGEGPAALALALTRARRRLVLVGDAGTLVRRSQWRGVLDHLEEETANREAHIVGQLVRYLQGRGRHQSVFRLGE